MIRVMVRYPNQPGARFDEKYYLEKHMPMVADKLGKHGMKSWSVDKGIAGFPPGSPAEYLMQAQLNLENLEGLQAGLAAQGAGIVADIPNYTDLQPHIQINQVLR